jgi:hypothetical protein
MLASHIACIAHMGCDEPIVACLPSLCVPVEAEERLMLLDQQKVTGKLKRDKENEDIFKNYRE